MSRRIAVAVGSALLMLMMVALLRPRPMGAEQPDVETTRTTLGALSLEIPGMEAKDLYLSKGTGAPLLHGVTYDQEQGQYAFFEYDTRTGAVSHIPMTLSSGRYVEPVVFSRVGSNQRTWFATIDSFGYFDASERVVREVPLPRDALGRPRDPSGLSDFDRERWAERQINGMDIDGSGRVWLSRDYSDTLLVYNPASRSFSQVPMPEPGGVVAGYVRCSGNHVFVSTVRDVDDLANHDTTHYVYNTKSGKWRTLGFPGPFVGFDGDRLVFANQAGGRLESSAASSSAATRSVAAAFKRWEQVLSVRGDSVWTLPKPTQLIHQNRAAKRVYELPQRMALSSIGELPASVVVYSAEADEEGFLWASVRQGTERYILRVAP